MMQDGMEQQEKYERPVEALYAECVEYVRSDEGQPSKQPLQSEAKGKAGRAAGDSLRSRKQQHDPDAHPV